MCRLFREQSCRRKTNYRCRTERMSLSELFHVCAIHFHSSPLWENFMFQVWLIQWFCIEECCRCGLWRKWHIFEVFSQWTRMGEQTAWTWSSFDNDGGHPVLHLPVVCPVLLVRKREEPGNEANVWFVHCKLHYHSWECRLLACHFLFPCIVVATQLYDNMNVIVTFVVKILSNYISSSSQEIK